jgi:hypothetical protein
LEHDEIDPFNIEIVPLAIDLEAENSQTEGI